MQQGDEERVYLVAGGTNRPYKCPPLHLFVTLETAT